MTSNHQPNAAMHAVESLSDPGASQAARRATEAAPGSAAQDSQPDVGSEVEAHARRRTFFNADKRRFLAAADRCTKPGTRGAFTRHP